MNRAVGYVRVSSDSQIDNWSLPAQRRELENYCHQKGWQLVKIYSEEGISAHSDSIEKRPQFRHLLDDCKNGKFEIVAVHSLDRWSRNLRVTLETFKLLAEHRIAFVSVTENIDYSSPEGRLFIAMIGAFAQYFSDSLSKHTTKGMRQRAISGFQNGDVPFGYERCGKNCPPEHKGKVHIVEKEAEAVKELFQLYATGNYSLATLADKLNKRGFHTRNKTHITLPDGRVVNGPRPFTLYSVRWLLHNPFFTGKIRYSEQIYEGAHEAIIDSGLFDKVQDRLRKARSRGSTSSPSFRLYLLKGIARCIYCGYPLWADTSVPGYSYYREQKNSHADCNCPANGKAIRCNIIDEQVDSLVKSMTLEPSWRERIISKLANYSHQQEIIKERRQVEGKLRRLARAYIDGTIDDGDYSLQRKLLRDTLESLVVPETDAAINAGELIETLGLIWDKATLDEKHRLLTGMLEAVYIDLVAARSVVGIQPKPPFYSLFESLKQKPNNKVLVFDPNVPELEKEKDSLKQESDFGLVEAREGRTPRPEKSCQHFYRLSLLFIVARSPSANGVCQGQLINS